MSNTDYSFQGLDKWEQRLSEAVNKAYPKEFERMVVDIAVQLEGKAKEKTRLKPDTSGTSGESERSKNAGMSTISKFPTTRTTRSPWSTGTGQREETSKRVHT